jgi:hypothetical protein
MSGGNLPAIDSRAQQHVGGFDRKRGAQEIEILVGGVPRQAGPLLFGKLHAPPVLVASDILLAEPDPPRLGRRAFGGGDVRLELHCVRACAGRGIDIGVSRSQTPVMRLCDLGNHQTGVFAPGVCFHHVLLRPHRRTSSPPGGNKRLRR